MFFPTSHFYDMIYNKQNNKSFLGSKYHQVDMIKKDHYSIGDYVVLNGRSGLVCEKTHMDIDYYKIQYFESGKKSEFVNAKELLLVYSDKLNQSETILSFRNILLYMCLPNVFLIAKYISNSIWYTGNKPTILNLSPESSKDSESSVTEYQKTSYEDKNNHVVEWGWFIEIEDSKKSGYHKYRHHKKKLSKMSTLHESKTS